MKKIVPREKYTFIFEQTKSNDIECVAYETGRHMSLEDVSRILDISIISARSNLKKSIKKIYFGMKKKHMDMTPCDIFHSMATTFNINCVKEYRQFLRLFPNKIRSEIYDEARKTA